MDFSYVTKVANLKRTISEAEQLRNKINKENKKSIQWRVEHQASHHQLSEKYKQLESNYECLQQNMLQAQMEREKKSEAYLNEKQHRLQLLNKVTSTREICEALEKYTTGLQETLGRCRSDLSAVCDAYKNATDIVKNIKQQFKQTTDKMHTDIFNLEEKVKLLTESRNQLEQFCESSKQEASVRIANSEQRCAEEKQRVQELRTLLQEESLRGNNLKMIIEQMEKEAAIVQKELQDLSEQMNKTVTEMEADLLKQDNTSKLLKKDINDYVQSMALLREENNKTQYSLSVAESNIQRSTVKYQQLKDSITKYDIIFENLRKESIEIEEQCQDLKNSKETELRDKIAITEELITTIAKIKIDNDCKEAEIIKMQEECKIDKNDQLKTEANLSMSKDEIIKLKEEIECYNGQFNDMLSKWKKRKDENFKLQEVIETQKAKSKENKAKLEELQKMYNEEMLKSTNIIKEKEDLTAVILEHNTEIRYGFLGKVVHFDQANIILAQRKTIQSHLDDYKTCIAELEKLIEEKKMERQVTSMKSAAVMSAASQDNYAVLPSQPLADAAPIRNDMFFAMPTATDVYNYNFSDSSQGSLHITDFSGILSKNNQMKSQATHKRKKGPQRELPAREAERDRAPRPKIFKTKNVYNRKANDN